jgi:pimeloyl-ACP methyl ester carboxylesterase
MPYVSVCDDRVFYSYHASEKAKAPHLVLVHGAGGNHRLWGYAVRSLPASNVYALDLPGHGRSGGAGRWTIADYASVIDGFLNALQLERAVIAGHSMGGATAIEVGLRHAHRVAGLVLVATGARLRVLPDILHGTLNAFEDTVRFICATAYSSQVSPQLVRQGEREMLKVAPQTVHDDFAACDAFDAMHELDQLRCPTLVICGTEDRLTPPKYAAFLAQTIPGAELKLIPGAGHMVIIEKPELVAAAIADAVARWKL